MKPRRSNHPLAARIKKLMQSDDEVGKIAQATPVLIERALDLFLKKLVDGSADVAAGKGAKTLTAAHLKAYISSEPIMDFLCETVAHVPDLADDDKQAPKAKRQRVTTNAPVVAAEDAAAAEWSQLRDSIKGKAPAGAPRGPRSVRDVASLSQVPPSQVPPASAAVKAEDAAARGAEGSSTVKVEAGDEEMHEAWGSPAPSGTGQTPDTALRGRYAPERSGAAVLAAEGGRDASMTPPGSFDTDSARLGSGPAPASSSSRGEERRQQRSQYGVSPGDLLKQLAGLQKVAEASARGGQAVTQPPQLLPPSLVGAASQSKDAHDVAAQGGGLTPGDMLLQVLRLQQQQQQQQSVAAASAATASGAEAGAAALQAFMHAAGMGASSAAPPAASLHEQLLQALARQAAPQAAALLAPPLQADVAAAQAQHAQQAQQAQQQAALMQALLRQGMPPLQVLQLLAQGQALPSASGILQALLVAQAQQQLEQAQAQQRAQEQQHAQEQQRAQEQQAQLLALLSSPALIASNQTGGSKTLAIAAPASAAQSQKPPAAAASSGWSTEQTATLLHSLAGVPRPPSLPACVPNSMHAALLSAIREGAATAVGTSKPVDVVTQQHVLLQAYEAAMQQQQSDSAAQQQQLLAPLAQPAGDHILDLLQRLAAERAAQRESNPAPAALGAARRERDPPAATSRVAVSTAAAPGTSGGPELAESEAGGDVEAVAEAAGGLAAGAGAVEEQLGDGVSAPVAATAWTPGAGVGAGIGAEDRDGGGVHVGAAAEASAFKAQPAADNVAPTPSRVGPQGEARTREAGNVVAATAAEEAPWPAASAALPAAGSMQLPAGLPTKWSGQLARLGSRVNPEEDDYDDEDDVDGEDD